MVIFTHGELVGILKLNYKGYTHYTRRGGCPGDLIIQQRACLPSQSGKVEEGALVNLTDYSMKLLEKKVQHPRPQGFLPFHGVFQYTTAQPERKSRPISGSRRAGRAGKLRDADVGVSAGCAAPSPIRLR